MIKEGEGTMSHQHRTFFVASAIAALSVTLAALAACAIDDSEEQQERAATLDEPRMSDGVYHVSIHLFTEGFTADEVADRARKIKNLVLNNPNAPTCYEGPKGRAQIAVQTEYTVLEYAQSQGEMTALDERLDALFGEGLAVHLLLPLHTLDGLPNSFGGVDWSQKKNWSNSSYFMPMQPCPSDWVEGEKCPYDVLADEFQKPVIEHLVETGRAHQLAVIYVGNEFGYNPDQIKDTPADWGNAANWQLKRAEAMAWTAARVLSKAREAANGAVPVGLKFIQVANQKTGWAFDAVHQTDQLAHILNGVMGPNGDVLGYDAYFGANDFDGSNRARLAPFLHWFVDGRFELSEFGRVCDGLPGEVSKHDRTRATDITGAAAAWSEAMGLNLFAFTTGADDQHAGCYALTNPVNPNMVYPHAKEEARGLWAQIQTATGTDIPTSCGEAPCSPTVDSVAPLSTSLGQSQTFTVSGSCLPPTLAAWIGECENLEMKSSSPTLAKFSCTPSWTTGLKAGVIKDKPGGAILKEFSVLVQ
jgi:hypothetical protein